MKTALVTPCFLGGKDLIGNDRVERNARYLNYYGAIQKEIGFDEIFLFDNASDLADMNRMSKLTFDVNSRIPIHLLRFQERLVRSDRPHDYPYCWRALWAIDELIGAGFEKIISIDSDAFVLTRRLARYVRQSASGWESLWCKNYNFPEAAFHILNRDAFRIYREYTSVDWRTKVGTVMEHDIPFTGIARQFNTSRWGDLGGPPQDHSMDLYCNAPLEVDLQFGKFNMLRVMETGIGAQTDV